MITNPKGTKILGAFPNDPLAGIVTAQGLSLKVGKNQSNAFGKAVGAINNWILGWTTVTGIKEATAARVSDNALRAKQAEEVTKQVGYQTAPTIYDPALQAVSRAGGAPVTP